MFKIETHDFNWLTEEAKTLLQDYYVQDGESIPELFQRASISYCFGDYKLAERIYGYVKNQWFMFSSPILSNGTLHDWPLKKDPWIGSRFRRNQRWLSKQEKPRGLPISCFLSYVPDTIEGQFDADEEMSRLSVAGGGVGQHLGMRGVTSKSPGAIPYAKNVDAKIMYYKQGETRKGAVACYLDVSHPDILEFIGIRKPSGGDPNRKAFNIHNAVNITDDFMEAVANDWDWDLVAPNNFEVVETVKARVIWESLLETRYKTGEPYLNNISAANHNLPFEMQRQGLQIHGSNLCNEIHLPTDKDRTAVCCLSSVNLAYFDDWVKTDMVKDLITFLDNVIEYFITMAPKEMHKAVYSALRSRDLGLGAMGWHEYLQKNDIPFDSGGFNSAIQKTNQLFSEIKRQAVQATKALAKVRGIAPDSYIRRHRNCHLLAIAPNANSSIILGTSPSIEPWKSNGFMRRTRVGSYMVKNPTLDKYIKDKFPEKYEDLWDRIIKAEGSVQDIEEFPGDIKRCHKTADEIPQEHIIVQGRHRQQHLCQGQSINVFFKAGESKARFNYIHAMAFAPAMDGVPLKGLYYTRTKALKKGEDIGKQVEREALKDFSEEPNCISCQG